MTAGGAHLIVFANEKGGCGKSTAAVHVAVAAARAGYRVAALDLDHRQRTFSRYLENRAASAQRLNLRLPHVPTDTLDPSAGVDIIQTLDRIGLGRDLVIVDTPGREDVSTRAALARAETLVTPINDSFVDLDLLGTVDSASFSLSSPSFYTRWVWEIRRQRAERGDGPLDWVVIRNRLQHLDARNKMRVASALDALAARVGFRVLSGLSERVAYREMFLEGFTVLDLKTDGGTSASRTNAQREVVELFNALRLPKVKVHGSSEFNMTPHL